MSTIPFYIPGGLSSSVGDRRGIQKRSTFQFTCALLISSAPDPGPKPNPPNWLMRVLGLVTVAERQSHDVTAGGPSARSKPKQRLLPVNHLRNCLLDPRPVPQASWFSDSWNSPLPYPPTSVSGVSPVSGAGHAQDCYPPLSSISFFSTWHEGRRRLLHLAKMRLVSSLHKTLIQ